MNRIMHAAASKLLQSCPTLCDPIGDSPPGSPVPGILQARILEWVAISFSKDNAYKALNPMPVTENIGCELLRLYYRLRMRAIMKPSVCSLHFSKPFQVSSFTATCKVSFIKFQVREETKTGGGICPS